MQENIVARQSHNPIEKSFKIREEFRSYSSLEAEYLATYPLFADVQILVEKKLKAIAQRLGLEVKLFQSAILPFEDLYLKLEGSNFLNSSLLESEEILKFQLAIGNWNVYLEALHDVFKVNIHSYPTLSDQNVLQSLVCETPIPGSECFEGERLIKFKLQFVSA